MNRQTPEPRPVAYILLDEEASPPTGIDQIATGIETETQRPWTSVLRPLAEPLAVLMVAASLMAVYGLTRHQGPAATSRAAVTTSPQAGTAPALPAAPQTDRTAARPGLIAPASAHPGQQVTIVGFRRDGLCGATELRFDDATVTYRVDATAALRSTGWESIFMVTQIPDRAEPGTHRIKLIGPAPGGGRNRQCDTDEHQQTLDSVDISLTIG
jgi:hypothetical protein